MSDWVTTTLAELTLDEKLSLLAGADAWHTVAIDRLGVPALKLTDGPNGARGADGNHGPTSASFPVGAAMGATWDPSLIEEVGTALAEETKAKGAHVLLGPTVNIPRIPNAGRNFECFSEDPFLSGSLAAAWVRGLQAEGVGACIKHFVCNDQERDRHTIDAVVSERALREIYMEPFRIAIDEAGPWAAMSAYNTINGTTASEHTMLDETLRADLGFDGLIVSDWYGTYGPGVMSSGLDLEMPGPGRWLSPELLRAALDDGNVSEADIDRKVQRLLTLIERTGARSAPHREERAEETAERRQLARRVAIESTVLLSNSGVLPLGTPQRIALIGELAAATPHQGGGSSSVNPHRVVSILDGFESAIATGVDITWKPGCRVRKSAPPIAPTALAGDGLAVAYFRGGEPVGEPARSVVSSRSYLSFFGDGDSWVDYADFAVRITGTFVAQSSGMHRFEFGGLGRLRVRLGGELVFDAWTEGEHETGVDRRLNTEEPLAIEVEYASTPGSSWRWLRLGCSPPGPVASIEEAADAAATADVAVVVVGLGPEWESEGFDRPDLRLPGRQDELVAAVATRQPNTVVVIAAGAPVAMPWLDDVGAVLMAWYGGQEVGHAVADVLFGRVDPGGRLPVTFPATSQPHPAMLTYPGQDGQIRYDDDVHVGYRGFETLGIEPMFTFGHGLSYTRFELEAVGGHADRSGILLDLRLANAGAREGCEVIQIYANRIGGVARRLVAFQKVRVPAGDEKSLKLRIPAQRLRCWDADRRLWRQPEGVVDLLIAGSFGTKSIAVELRAEP